MNNEYFELAQELHNETMKCTKFALFLAYLPKDSLLDLRPFKHALYNHSANVYALESMVKNAWIDDFSNV